MKIILISLLVFLGISANAQVFKVFNQEVGFVYVGPKVGFGGAWLSNASVDEATTKTLFGFQLGAVGKFGLTESLSIQPELLYSRKGSKIYDDQLAGLEYNSTNIASYIGIPILAKFSFLKIRKIRFHASGGIYNNISISHKHETKYENESFEETYKYETTQYKRVDFGFSVGAGLDYDLSHGVLVGELLVEHGAVDMYTNVVNTESNRNTTVTIAITYLYDFVDLGKRIFRKEMDKKKAGDNEVTTLR